MRVAFRVDASLVIGTGHVMRCLTLAHALRMQGADILFLSREHPGNLCHLMQEQGFTVARLPVHSGGNLADRAGIAGAPHAGWLGASWQEDAELAEDAIGNWGAVDWLVVDHYALDARWESRLRPATSHIMVIDDLADRSHDCDLLLDQNYHDDPAARYGASTSQACIRLLGPEYALLRPEFALTRARLRKRSGSVRRILVFFGGTDLANQTGVAIDALLSLGCDDIHMDIVIGGANPRRCEIERLCSTHSALHFHCQTSRMGDLMASADLAIGGGGVALLERCAVALPAIVLALAENQVPASRALAGIGGVLYLGRASDISAAQLAEAIQVMRLAPELMRHMSDVAGRITDGDGTERVIARMQNPSLSLRRSTIDDRDDVWRWRNHPSVRRFSGDASAIDLEEHRQWFESVLGDPDRALLIAEDDAGAVGVLRYDIAPRVAYISVYLVPGREGKGLGTTLIRAGEAWLQAHRPDVQQIRADIAAGNESSIRAFARAGFVADRLSYVRSLGGS